MLRDPYSAKPYVPFYTTKRVGGGVQDYDAIKLRSSLEEPLPRGGRGRVAKRPGEGQRRCPSP